MIKIKQMTEIQEIAKKGEFILYRRQQDGSGSPQYAIYKGQYWIMDAFSLEMGKRALNAFSEALACNEMAFVGVN